MELPTHECDGTNQVAFNFVLSDSLGGNELLDGENAVPIMFPPDFDINKLWKNGNGVQVLFIDSSQVGIVSENCATIITSSPLPNEIDGSDHPDLTEAEVSRNLSDSFHLETSVANDLLSCSDCDATFKKNADYKRHQLQHLDKKPHQCTYPSCNLSFNVEKNLKLHMALHKHNTSSQCPECDKKFSRLASLKAHISLHIEEDTLTCQQCDNEFETMRALRRHIEEEHQLNKTAPLTLAELNRSFKGSANHGETDAVKKIFPCKQCHVNFNTMKALKEHSRHHQKVNSILSCKKKSKNNKIVGKLRFKCSHCPMEFDKPSLCARHERVHTGERPYKCDQCSRGFSQKNSLVSHQKAIHGREKPYQCTLCPYASSQKGNLRAHVRRLHLLANNEQQGDVHRCDDCSAVFRNVSSLTSHMSKFHCDGIQTTLTLSHVQNSDSAPSLHDNNESASRDDLSHKNDILQKALERIGLPVSDGDVENSDQRNDEQDKTKDRSVCTTTLVDRANPTKLVQYVVEYRMEGSVRFLLCTHCPKRFKKPLDLVRHLRIHNSIMPYKCAICYKSFRLKSTLMSHLNSHNGTKAFECSVCKKKLASQASLVLHQRLHNGQRPYCCQFCGKQFRHRNYFKIHLQSHQRSAKNETKASVTSEEPPMVNDRLKTGRNTSVTLAEPLELTESGILPRLPVNAQLFSRSEEKNGSRPVRPFKCLKCGAAFKKSAHLNQHIQTHSGLKPFNCNICLRNFVSKWVLKAHHLTHERISAPNFQCSECNRSFTTRGTLNRHKASHSDSRPFLCPYCQKSFKTYSVCKKHVVAAHTNEVIRMQEAQSFSDMPQVSIDAETLENSTTLPSISEAPAETNWDLLNYEPNNMPTDTSTTQPNDESSLIETREVTDVLSLPCTTSALNDTSSFGPMQLGMAFDGEEASDVTDAQAHSDLPTIYDSQVLSQSFTFQETELLTASQVDDSNREDTKCLSCGREFKRASHLKTHLRSNCGGNKAYICPICTKSFSNVQSLTAHQKSHANPDPVHCVCDSCGLKFPSFQLYLRHAEDGCTQTNGLETSFKDQDSTIFTNVSSTQEGGLPIVVEKTSKSLKECSECKKSFKKQSDLVRHMRTHTGERPFSCSVCDKSFTLKSTLTAHLRTHSVDGNKTISCNFCEGRYSCRNTLRIHMRIHTGDKPFKCPECHLSFRTTGHRQSHLKSHRKAAQADGKAGSLRTVSAAPNKRRLKANKSIKQRISNGDIDTGTHMTKVIAITSDLSNQHNSLSDQTGSLANLTVKFHVDEAGNVQLPTLDSNTLLDLSELFLTQTDGQVQGITLTQEMNLSHLLNVGESNRDELSKNLMNSESGLRLLAGNHEGTMLVSSSHVVGQHQSEVEESADHAILLEAVDPVVILGASNEKSPERVSVITTSRNRNFQK